ncbi:hypothetical protein BDN72DRAFT_740845, partial [Pluteus cervinus]
KLSPFKAPGPDEIPNIVLKKCASTLAPILLIVYRCVLYERVYPDEWKKFTTVVLRKPGKPDYEVPKAYRPIALYNTLAKLL